MKHNISHRKLNRTSSHRKALLMNLSNSLIKHEQITTTLTKARELRPFVEKIVTLGKKGTLESRRKVIAILQDEKMTKKIFDAFDEEKMTGGLLVEGQEANLRPPRLPGMEFDEEGRISGQEDLSFVTFDALGKASEWAMPDPFMYDADGEVLAVQPPPAFLFGDSGHKFGMHQDDPHFFNDDHGL